MFIIIIEQMTGFYTKDEIDAFNAWKAKTKLCDRYLEEVYENIKKPWISEVLSETDKYKLFLKHYAKYKSNKMTIFNEIKKTVFSTTEVKEIPSYDSLIVSKYICKVPSIL